MGMRAPRMCSRCTATATHGKYCERHKDADKQRERTYRNPELRKQYKTKAWLQTRAQVLSDQEQCQHRDDNGTQCPRLSTDVHHVIRAEDWLAQGHDFCDTDNLEALCHEHHSARTAQETGWNQRIVKRCKSSKLIFSIAECAVILGRSRQTTSRIFEKEPGVIVIERPEGPDKRGYRSITVPRSVLTRVLGRLSKGGAIAAHYAKQARS